MIDLITDLTLLSMIGIVDPPRPEAKAAIAECHRAGIQVRMITGDHAVTAAAIGRELGITGTASPGPSSPPCPTTNSCRSCPRSAWWRAWLPKTRSGWSICCNGNRTSWP
ncbi:MAG: HAD family hydrolase [Caldilineaceae bacterium]